MSTIIEAPKGNFTPHPEGTFLATMCDCWLETMPNPWKGQQRDKKDPSKGIDERETITELFLAFLTEEPIEINGELKPSYVRYRATASVAENSNLRKFLKGWFPKLGDDSFSRFDADKLIGRGAYITVVQKEGKKGPYSFVINAAAPPKGSTTPIIPADFVRKSVKEAQAAQAAATASEQGQTPATNPNPIQPRADHPPMGGQPGGPAYKAPSQEDPFPVQPPIDGPDDDLPW